MRVFLSVLWFGCQALGCSRGLFAEGGMDEAHLNKQREALMKDLRRDIRDEQVLRVMEKVPRHEFVPTRMVPRSYENKPLSIGEDQTISQPYIVAYMTQALKLTGTEKVLEIGTGSGYQAAVLAELAREVYSIEIVAVLSNRARFVLDKLGYQNVQLKVGDGFDGWPENAPFDAVIVTAAPDEIPPPLIAQLEEGGRLVIPVSSGFGQSLETYVKKNGKLTQIDQLPVRFVPMTGKAQTK